MCIRYVYVLCVYVMCMCCVYTHIETRFISGSYHNFQFLIFNFQTVWSGRGSLRSQIQYTAPTIRDS